MIWVHKLAKSQLRSEGVFQIIPVSTNNLVERAFHTLK